MASETSRMRCSRRSGVSLRPPPRAAARLPARFAAAKRRPAAHKSTKRQSGRQSRPGLRSKPKKGLEAERELARRSTSKPFFIQTAAIQRAANIHAQRVFCFSFDSKEKRSSPVLLIPRSSPQPSLRPPQQPLLPCQRAPRLQCGCPRPRASGVRPAWCGRTRGWNPRPCG